MIRLDVLAVLSLALLACSFFALRLDTPPWYSYDEVYHAYTGAQYAQGNTDAFAWGTTPRHVDVEYVWSHPPLGLWLIAAGVRLFGDNALGWRLPSALFGALGVALAYGLGLRLSGSRLAGTLAALLLPLSGLYLAQSRTSMLDIFLCAFSLAALISLHTYLSAPPDRVRGPLLATGLFVGLAVATKWSGAYVLPFIALAVGWRWRSLHRASRSRKARAEVVGGARLHMVWAPAALVALPLAVYLLAYRPYFASGRSVGEWAGQQRLMLGYHAGLREAHPYQSAWWSWPLTLRGVHYAGAHDATRVLRTYALGNPLVFWALLPAVAWACRALWRRRDAPGLWVLAIGFWGQWLPWALVPRSTFLYHFLPALPWGCLAAAMAVGEGWRRGGAWRVAASAYVLAVVAAFAFFYPIYTSLPLSPDGLEARMWLDSWR